MNTYVDRHEAEMSAVENVMTVAVALDMDHRRFDRTLNRCTSLDEVDNMADRSPMFANGSSMINEHFV